MPKYMVMIAAILTVAVSCGNKFNSHGPLEIKSWVQNVEIRPYPNAFARDSVKRRIELTGLAGEYLSAQVLVKPSRTIKSLRAVIEGLESEDGGRIETSLVNIRFGAWLPVDETVQPEGDLRIVNFCGGLYAITRFKGLENIGKVRGELVKWREGSKYKHGNHQCLEHLLEGPDKPPEAFVFDLYLPIAE